MTMSRFAKPALSLLLGFLGILASQPAARAAKGDEEIVAVASQASRNYVRATLPDGSVQPETYAFGNGGHVGGPLIDDTIDKLDFNDVARVAVGPLAQRRYVQAKDPNRTDLLIMVYWGTTTGTRDTSSSLAYTDGAASQSVAPPPPPPPQHGGASAGPASATAQTMGDMELSMIEVANRQKDDADMKNAMLLGYDSELIAGKMLQFTALRKVHSDLVSDLEDNRYFVILMAYDFPTLLKQKKHKLQWVIRISLRQRGHDFGKDLPAMLTFASRYFGEETDGLVREPIPEGHVEVGVPTTIGVEPEK